MKKAVLVLCFFSHLSPLLAQLKIDEEHFIRLFNNRDYVTVFSEAYELRKKEYGKTPLVDYFIAKSLCALEEYSAANECFHNIMDIYSLTAPQRQFFTNEMNDCMQAATARPVDRYLYYVLNLSDKNMVPRAYSRGKMGYVLDCEKDSAAFKFEARFDSINFNERLFPLDKAADGVSYYKSLVGNSYEVIASGRFIFITPDRPTFDKRTAADVAARLEKAYDFYSSYFDVRPPDKVITVYLMQSQKMLKKMALKTHGLTIPSSNIGYSVPNDLSVLGNSDEKNIGTIYHELFHLMIRTDIGDIPGWLDEGIASLYATSSWTGDTLKGEIHQWRTQVLRDYKVVNGDLPTLRELIKNNWGEFSVTATNSACDVAVNYAIAHHLSIYFQERGVLQQIVAGYKNRRTIFQDTSVTSQTNEQVLEQSIGFSVDSLQRKFDAWLNDTYQLNIRVPVSQAINNNPEQEGVYQSMEKADQLHTRLMAFAAKGDPCSKSSEFNKAMAGYDQFQRERALAMNNNNNVQQVAMSENIPPSFRRAIKDFIHDGEKAILACDPPKKAR